MLDEANSQLVTTQLQNLLGEQPSIYKYCEEKIRSYPEERRLMIWRPILDYYGWELTTYPTPDTLKIEILLHQAFDPQNQRYLAAFKAQWQESFQATVESLTEDEKDLVFRVCFNLTDIFASEKLEQYLGGQLQN